MYEQVSVSQWLQVVARARLGKAVKAIAKELARFADYDTGMNCRPGLARLSWEAEYSYEATAAAVGNLRDLGLIVKTGVWSDADVYRLALPDAARFMVPSPTQHEAAIARIREKQRGTYKGGGRKNKKRLPLVFPGAETQDISVCPEENTGQTEMSAPGSSGGTETSAPNSGEICPLNSSGLPNDLPVTTIHPEINVDRDVLVPSGSGREQDGDSPAAVTTPEAEHESHRCTHGNNRRRCVTCRRETKSGVTTPPAGPTVTTPEPGQTHCEHGWKTAYRGDGLIACPFCRRGLSAKESTA